MADLKCQACGGPVFIMGRTSVFIGTGIGPRTAYYAAHDYGGAKGGTRPDHPAALPDADVRLWAAEAAARERLELKRVRKPAKKEHHAGRLASYLEVAERGLSSPAWLQGEI